MPLIKPGDEIPVIGGWIGCIMLIGLFWFMHVGQVKRHAWNMQCIEAGGTVLAGACVKREAIMHLE